MHGNAIQTIEQQVSYRQARLSRLPSQNEYDLESEAIADRCGDARPVRLKSTAYDQRARSLGNRPTNHEFELSTLLPPSATPVRSSRLKRIRGPPSASLKRRASSSGVGSCASLRRGSSAVRRGSRDTGSGSIRWLTAGEDSQSEPA